MNQDKSPARPFGLTTPQNLQGFHNELTEGGIGEAVERAGRTGRVGRAGDIALVKTGRVVFPEYLHEVTDEERRMGFGDE